MIPVKILASPNLDGEGMVNLTPAQRMMESKAPKVNDQFLRSKSHPQSPLRSTLGVSFDPGGRADEDVEVLGWRQG